MLGIKDRLRKSPKRLFAAAIAWISPVRCKLNSSIGMTFNRCEYVSHQFGPYLTVSSSSSAPFDTKSGALTWLSHTCKSELSKMGSESLH
jgi:hypothetical protein